MLQYGGQIQHLEKAAKMGQRVRALENMPDVDPGLNQVWTIFADLNAKRSSGFSANPISMSDILAAFELFGISDWHARRWYYDVIKKLDDHMMAEYRRKSEESKDAGSKN